MRPFTFPEHLSARTMTSGPVRTSDLLRRCDSASRRALRPFLDAAPGCLESVSTTDVSRHEHSPETPLPETAHRAPWETRQRPTSRPTLSSGRFRRSDEDGAGPPCGHPASSDPMLDGMAPASGRAACPPFQRRSAGWLLDRRELFRLRATPPVRTLWHLCSAIKLVRGTQRSDNVAAWHERLFLDCVSPVSPVHVNATGLRELEVPSIAGDQHTCPCERVCGAFASAGRQGRSPHVFIAVSKNVD